ncbi:MAG TPA: DUF4238 domain-containing protein [Nitrososphaera sp.]|jgi:hypothetical protein|nr:DUF4238 domain-containing protein [Nitrososphaera sp.]
MAGINQHYLPRLLLKGFASRIAGKEIFTWAYHRGKSVFEPNIKGISAERYFYGKQGEVSADDEITELEGEYGAFIDELREKDDGVQIHDSRVVEFIAHLCIRTKHLRDSLRESSEFLMDKISEYLSDYDNIKKFILGNPKLAEEVVGKMMDEHQFPPVYKDMLIMLVTQWAPILLDENQSEFKMMVESLVEPFKNMIPKALKQEHIKLLAQHPIPEPRVEDYKKLRWFVYAPANSVILGDVGVLIETSSTKRFKSLNDKDDEIRNIFLPISSNRVIVGTPLSYPKINFDINEVIAKCSREFFISSTRSSEMDSLHLKIGEESEVISKEELEQIVSEGFIHKNIEQSE